MRINLLKHLFCFTCLRVGLYMYRATFNNISILFVEHSEPLASIKQEYSDFIQWSENGVLRFTHWPESEVRTSSPIWNQSTRIYPLIWFWSIRSYPLTIYRSILRKKHWPNASYWQSIFDRHDLPEIMLKMVLNIKS